MKVLQILLLTVGLVLFATIFGKVSAQNTTKGNSNLAVNRYSANSATNVEINKCGNQNTNRAANETPISNEKPQINPEGEYDFNFGEVPQFLKIISTEKTVTFPKHGKVKAQVIEEVGKPFVIRFVHGYEDKLISQFVMNQNSFIREYFYSAVDPKIRLKVIQIEGLPSPLVHMVIAQPGGSDYSFWSALFGEVNGKIKLLTPPTTTFSWEGGVQLGDLGKGNGVGVAIWNAIWDDNESHHGEHRYQVEFYHFNKKLEKFIKAKQIKTKEKYETPNQALESLGLGFYHDAVRDFPEFLEYRENY
ncbi:MAG: hypothetical protein K1X72_15940 [Pyrinomonadaceae bacterium]|nr:hypothetical protein [Pyrinomonadaceae bacterium]